MYNKTIISYRYQAVMLQIKETSLPVPEFRFRYSISQLQQSIDLKR